MAPQAALALAFRRKTGLDSTTIRKRVAKDAAAVGGQVWPNGMGFDIGPLVQVGYPGGLPWVSYVQDLATVAELEARVGQKTCPACGTTLNKLTGQDGYTVRPVVEVSGGTITGRILEAKQLATIYTCPACDHCEGGR